MVSSEDEHDLQDRDGGEEPDADPDARDVHGREAENRRDRHDPRSGVAERHEVPHVAGEAGGQRRRDARVHDQQALPAVEERHARPVRLAQVDVAAAGLRDSARRARRSRARRRGPCRPSRAQTSSTPSGEASVRMIVPGVRKMPTAMTWPTTSAVAAGSLSSRRRARAVAIRSVARTANWNARGPPEPNTPPAVLTGLPEARRAQVAGIGRIVAVAHEHVGVARSSSSRSTPRMLVTLNRLKTSSDRLDAHRPPRERPRHAQVERR